MAETECICGAVPPCDVACAKHGGILHGYPCRACEREWEAANPRTAAAISRFASGKGGSAAAVAQARRADAASRPADADAEGGGSDG